MPKFTAPAREGGFYISGDEKDELVEQGTTLEVISVERGKNPFGDGDRFLTTVVLDGTERGLSYNAGASSRDEFLTALGEYLDTEQDQETVEIKLVRVKTSNGRWMTVIKLAGEEDVSSDGDE